MKVQIKKAHSFYFIFFFLFSCIKNEKKMYQHREIKIENEQSINPIDSLVINYWNNYDFKDTMIIKNPDISSRKLINFIRMFPATEHRQIAKAIKSMLENASENKKVFIFFKNEYEKLLYNSNSPIRNDLYYLPVLEYLVNTNHLNELEKIRYKKLLRLIKKNMPGSITNNFIFIDTFGQYLNLHKIKAQVKLLIFYDPECPHCTSVIEEIKQNSQLNILIDQRKLKIVVICPGKKIGVWKAYQNQIPNTWVNGFDKKRILEQKELYDLKAFPTIYVIGADNKVILKDANLEEVLHLLKCKVSIDPLQK
jgi:hypothetical protein